MKRATLIFVCLVVFSGVVGAADAPTPLLTKGHAVDWWFVYKFNRKFPGCGGDADRQCPFGGTKQKYQSFGQQFVYASSENASLQKGSGCAGATISDPVGSTFDQIYNGAYSYVIWNDQFYNDPKIPGCAGTSCGGPWDTRRAFLPGTTMARG